MCEKMAVTTRPRTSPPLDLDEREALAQDLYDIGAAANLALARVMASNPANWPNDDE